MGDIFNVQFIFLTLTYTIFMIFLLDYSKTRKEKKKHIKYVKADEFEEVLIRGQVIDVRTKEEFNNSHILGARSLPLSDLKRTNGGLRKDKTVFIYCNKGKSASKAAQKLYRDGFNSIVVMKDEFENFKGKLK